jgi:hypothetical protein
MQLLRPRKSQRFAILDNLISKQVDPLIYRYSAEILAFDMILIFQSPNTGINQGILMDASQFY